MITRNAGLVHSTSGGARQIVRDLDCVGDINGPQLIERDCVEGGIFDMLFGDCCGELSFEANKSTVCFLG